MTDNKNNLPQDGQRKTELANRIARQSEKMADSYRNVGTGVAKVFRGFSSFIDRVLFNRKYSILVALVLSILLYLIVNYNSLSSVFSVSLTSSRTLTEIPVTTRYNSDTFEVTGLPSTVTVTLTGDASSVTSAVTSDGKIIADLEGMTEGSHEVRLSGEGYGDNVNVIVDPSTAYVTLKKKTTQQFDLSYDFINQGSMENIYSVGTPVFEYSKVNVRASQDTLNSIAFVKALIDVSGQSADFEQDAILIAYDASGYPVTADIVPDTVHVTVPVTSPSKVVPIEVQVTGEVPEGKAINAITSDQQTVTIYASESVLAGIDKVVVTLNASTITKDSTILRPITLPAGVNSSNINQITISVTLAEGVTKTITDVPINYRNNLNNYKASQPENITTVTVQVFGTEENVSEITADDIYVYVDLKDAVVGLQEFTLQVDQPSTGLVRYSLEDSVYELNILGETNEDTDTSGGSDSNNG